MSILHPHAKPSSGLQGLKDHWRNDLIAAFSVSMVALPLSLGIALASGAPATAGIFAALIGGFVATFLRGSHIAINGPGNGLIAVILTGVLSFGNDPNRFNYVLAAIVVAGVLQTLIGLLRLGKLGEVFPSSVIHGILAAIGLIILGKQVHVALGASTTAKSTLGVLAAIPASVMALNPYVVIVSVTCLALLVIYPYIENKLFHLIPAPMWVLLIAIPLGLYLNFSSTEPYTLFGAQFKMGPKFLVPIEGNLLKGLMFPNFAKIWTLPFWSLVISITLLSSIETLISANAVDKLDPYKRQTDANKELMGMGVSSVLAGCIGGLPIVTVIARSSVNIHNYAKTPWSNFFHSTFLLIFLLLLAPLIQMVPMAALAAILVYTGYKLASPKVFRDARKKGWEQLLFLLVTLAATLYTDLVRGLLLGTAFVLLFHIIRTGTSPSVFLRSLWETKFILESTGDNRFKIAPKGIVNFGNILRLQNTLNTLPERSHVDLDMSGAALVDLTVLEYIHNMAEKHHHTGGHFALTGMDLHQSSSNYPQGLRIMGAPAISAPARPAALSRRQKERAALAQEKGWTFNQEIDWNASYLKNFQFFETRPLEYKENVISGHYNKHNATWEIADLTFDEGALLVEEYHTTAQIVHLPWELPEFVIEREEFYDRLMEYVGHEDIDFKYFTKLSHMFVVKGYDGIDTYFTPKQIKFFETHDIYHLESNGEALLIFRRFRLERTKGIMAMHQFSKELLDALHPDYAEKAEQVESPAADTSNLLPDKAIPAKG